MGCIDSKPAVQKPVVPLRGVSEQHIDLHLASKQQNKRNNVFTAGAVDVSHVDLKAKNFPKTRDQEKIIRACIESPEAFFFQGISEEEKQLLFNAMQATTVQAGHPIIVQGDHGDNFYIVESGTFYATLGGKRIKDYGRGMFFGELALAYNKPRAATVKAETAGSVFSLDRETFRFILQNSATNKVKEVKAALQKVSLLEGLSPHDLSKIAEIVEIVPYKMGAKVISKGDSGKLFFMIKSGTVKVSNIGSSFGENSLGPGEYFGEQALINNTLREADICAASDCQLMVLDRDNFTAILGPLREVLEHNANMRVLGTVSLFKNLTSSEKKKLFQSFGFEIFEQGRTIITEGEKGQKFYIIKEGEAKVIAGGTEITRLGKGQHFGEMALLTDGDVRKATIVAIRDCQCLTLDRATFSKMVSIQELLARETKEKNKEITNKLAVEGATNIKFGDLKQLAVLGSGTFGRVVLVQDKTSKAVYALKQLLKSEVVAHKQQLNVMNEKNVMIQCKHPFVLRLFQTFKDAKRLYMLLEFVQGGELFSVLHPAHPPRGVDGVPDHAAKFYAAGVILGLEHLHNKDIAYRDMKPENCLIDKLGYPKIVDFGFAKIIDSKSFTLCGTPEYLAPELVLGRGHTKAVDYWAFGILLYEMQSGYSPFSDPQGMDQVVICKNIVKGNLTFEKGKLLPACVCLCVRACVLG